MVLLFEPGGVSRRAHLEAEMDSLMVVVVDGHRNRFMEPREISMPVQVAKLQLEVTEPPLHEAVLPWAGALAATEGYLHPLT